MVCGFGSDCVLITRTLRHLFSNASHYGTLRTMGMPLILRTLETSCVRTQFHVGGDIKGTHERGKSEKKSQQNKNPEQGVHAN